jgi:hypothetical protein
LYPVQKKEKILELKENTDDQQRWCLW